MKRAQLNYRQVHDNLTRTYRMLKRQLRARSHYKVLYDSNVHMTQLSFRSSSMYNQIAKYDAIMLPNNALDANFAVGVPHVSKAFLYREYLFE